MGPRHRFYVSHIWLTQAVPSSIWPAVRAGMPISSQAVDIRSQPSTVTFRGNPKIRTICADLEGGGPWPLEGMSFGGIVVTNYLHRPLFGPIVESLAPGGVLIAETFAIGHQEFGRPHNPDFLLRKNEYLSALALPSGLTVVACEFGYEEHPKPAVMQRLCAVLGDGIPDLRKGIP